MLLVHMAITVQIEPPTSLNHICYTYKCLKGGMLKLYPVVVVASDTKCVSAYSVVTEYYCIVVHSSRKLSDDDKECFCIKLYRRDQE
jgi:hypothetical protein